MPQGTAVQTTGLVTRTVVGGDDVPTMALFARRGRDVVAVTRRAVAAQRGKLPGRRSFLFDGSMINVMDASCVRAWSGSPS